MGPGLADTTAGLAAQEIAQAAAGGELTVLYLLHCDPQREYPSGELWEKALQLLSKLVAPVMQGMLLLFHRTNSGDVLAFLKRRIGYYLVIS